MAALDLLHHLRLGFVHQLVGEALQAVSQGRGLRTLQFPGSGDPPPSDHSDGLAHDLDEPVVFLLDAAQQRCLVLGNVLQPVEVVTKLLELAERRLDHAHVDLLQRQRQGRSDAVELTSGVVLKLAVGGNLAMEYDKLLGPAVGLA